MIQKFLILILSLVLSFSASCQKEIEEIGHGIQLGLPVVSIGISLLKKDKKGAIYFLKLMALQTGSTIILKRAVNRKRPNGGEYSFPSGHTSLSFMSSTFLWRRYGWKWGIPATALAAFVGYSRAGIDDPVHHWSDVYAGAIIGTMSSLLLTKRYSSDVSIEVMGDTSFVGLKMRYKLH